jgi:hypothetical protein
LKVEGMSILTGEILQKYRMDNMLKSKKGDKFKMRFLAYRRLEVLEDKEG